MLKSLLIRNYAIIRELDISFQSGLTTMTGETGAGKSILLGALSLILGERADTSVLQNKSNKCIVEASFDNLGAQITNFLLENDLDSESELLIRREINVNGKSRAFVNDSPVNLQILKDLGLFLVDIHSQHENLNIANHQYQVDVIDAYGGTQSQANKFHEAYRKYLVSRKEYNSLIENRNKSLAELDFIKFQFEELEEAKLVEGEMEILESDIETLQHAEDIKAGLYKVWQLLNGDTQTAAGSVKEAEQELRKTSSYHKLSEELISRLESSYIEIKDIATEAEKMAEKIENNPKKLEITEERLNLLNKLAQKHHVKNSDELIELKNDFSDKIEKLDSMEFKLEALESDLKKTEKSLYEKAHLLSNKRMINAKDFQNKIVDHLLQLGIMNAGFSIANERKEIMNENGIDEIRFHFSANKNSPMQEIAKIASGGELSRLMLSIKSVISGSLGLPTIIFDEIDTGVSGEIAHRIASIMKKMSEDRQVLSITHLPQVAASGDQHYYVYKEDIDEYTEAKVKALSTDDRLVEIAKMLSGKKTTAAAMENAKELLKQ